MAKKLYNNEKGAAAILLAVSMFVLMALAGVVIDGGLLILSHTKLQAATQAAAKATISSYDVELWENEGIVELNEIVAKEYAKKYLEINLPEAQIEYVEVNPLKKNEAIVKTKLEVDLVFMRIFGMDKKVVKSVVRSIGS